MAWIGYGSLVSAGWSIWSFGVPAQAIHRPGRSRSVTSSAVARPPTVRRKPYPSPPGVASRGARFDTTINLVPGVGTRRRCRSPAGSSIRPLDDAPPSRSPAARRRAPDRRAPWARARRRVRRGWHAGADRAHAGRCARSGRDAQGAPPSRAAARHAGWYRLGASDRAGRSPRGSRALARRAAWSGPARARRTRRAPLVRRDRSHRDAARADARGGPARRPGHRDRAEGSGRGGARTRSVAGGPCTRAQPRRALAPRSLVVAGGPARVRAAPRRLAEQG